MLKHYFKTALKVLLRRKFFTFISLFAISFTLVVLMTTAAIMDHIFAPMAPETRQDRSLAIYQMEMKGENSTWVSGAGYGFLDKYARNLPGVELFSINSGGEKRSTYKDGYEIKSDVKMTDGNFWKILDFTFIEGTPFSDDDDKNANFVAVINRATRTKLFGSEPALGKFIELDQQRFRVIGVVENVPILRQTPYADVWVPIGTYSQVNFRSELMGEFHGLFLARSTDDFPAIKAEFKNRLKTVQFTDPEYNTMNGIPETFFESTSSEILDTRAGNNNPTGLMALLVGAMFLFMLLPTINLININISRIIERSSEIGVRKSFGASSWTLVGQFVVENIILTFIGGIIGFLLSLVVLHFLTASDLLRYADFHLNYRVFGYSLMFILIFGLLSGVYPAWKMSRMNPVNALKGALR